MQTHFLRVWFISILLSASASGVVAKTSSDISGEPSTLQSHLPHAEHIGSSFEEEPLPSWLTERRIIGNNNLEPVLSSHETESRNPSRSVARVETREGQGFCTASRIGTDLFLTNFHCYEFMDCEDIQFRLGYEKNRPEQEQRIFNCKEVLAKNERLDYALYRTDPAEIPQLESAENVPLEQGANDDPDALSEFPIATLWTGQSYIGQLALLASHPKGRLKEVDRSPACRIRTSLPEEYLGRHTITHTCDTEGGSSGSPVFDAASGRIVALHWGGTEEFNMAVPMYLIVQDWKKVLPETVISEMIIEK